jgi:oxygen-dependent protoporphyrinogen oxidase
MVNLALADLRDILGIKSDPEEVLLTRHPASMPQYELGHRKRVVEIEKLVAQLENLEIAGNAYNGVGMPDSVASGTAAAERLLAS